MPRLSLADRVTRLESELAELRAELRTAQPHPQAWRRTIGAFTDDPGMQELFRGAMRLREADRKLARKTRRKPAGKRG
jgi:hypothetical protein